jgi:acyl carrier protein
MNELGDSRGSEPSTRERVIALVRQMLGQPQAARPLPIDARLSDLGLSSIRMVNLMLASEMEFDLTIPQGEITPANFASIASVEALVRRLSGSAAL